VVARMKLGVLESHIEYLVALIAKVLEDQVSMGD